MNVQKNSVTSLITPSISLPPKQPCESIRVTRISTKDLLTILTQRTTTINATADKIKGALRYTPTKYRYKDDDDLYPDLNSRETAFAIFVDSFNAVCKFAAHDARSRGEDYTKGRFDGVPKNYERKLADDIIKVMFLADAFTLGVAEALIDKLSYGVEAEQERKRA